MVRTAAVTALCWDGSSSVVLDICEALADKVPSVREAAIRLAHNVTPDRRALLPLAEIVGSDKRNTVDNRQRNLMIESAEALTRWLGPTYGYEWNRKLGDVSLAMKRTLEEDLPFLYWDPGTLTFKLDNCAKEKQVWLHPNERRPLSKAEKDGFRQDTQHIREIVEKIRALNQDR
jgi:hypothetical protein